MSPASAPRRGDIARARRLGGGGADPRSVDDTGPSRSPARRGAHTLATGPRRGVYRAGLSKKWSRTWAVSPLGGGDPAPACGRLANADLAERLVLSPARSPTTSPPYSRGSRCTAATTRPRRLGASASLTDHSFLVRMNMDRLAVVQLPGHTHETGLANSIGDASANFEERNPCHSPCVRSSPRVAVASWFGSPSRPT